MADRKAQPPQAGSETWNKLPWRKLEQHVYRIQKRIYRASQHGKERTVHKLQKLLIKSEAARLLAIRRVTQDNQGKKTAGVDGVKSVQPVQRFAMVALLHPKHWKHTKPKPVRRVWIPKPGKSEQRPLGIPVMHDRAKQALAKLALEPEWEASFEANSYGFRPGRSAHDAIAAIFLAIRYKPKFVYDADIKGCFDNINQEALLEKLHTYPLMRQTIKGWLKAGVVDKYVFTPTRAGTPQGGIISPLLANIALHGMEGEAIGDKRKRNNEQPILIRYADDYVILHSDKDVLEQAARRVTDGLGSMGLAINPEKTRVTHTLTPHEGNVGFDFLGFTVRQLLVGKTHTGKNTQGKSLGFKTIIKPSKEAIKTHLGSINQKMKELRTAAQDVLIGALNPIIRGWCNYNGKVVSKRVFSGCDHDQFYQLLSWMKRRHPNKSTNWMRNKYWHREDDKRWVFAAPARNRQGEKYLLKLRQHSDTHIQRHVKVRGEASPYDGNLIYWAQRLKDQHPLMKQEEAKLLREQKGRCPRCGLYFREGDQMEIDHVLPTAMGGKDILGNKMVYHRHCHDVKTAEDLVHIQKFKAAQVSITDDHTQRSRVKG
jgi:RNA-directed DNA polymerase